MIKMPTYKKIRKWVLKELGLKLHSGGCHIAHCKEIAKLIPRNPNRKHLCPEHHREAIFAAFRHFGMIEG